MISRTALVEHGAMGQNACLPGRRFRFAGAHRWQQGKDFVSLDIDWVRSRFPALDTDWAFFDNGGGSQILQPVLDRIGEYLLTSNVQHGASYEGSQLASARLRLAEEAVATLINARHASEVVMGGSSTLLLQTLATCFGATLDPGDEVIVSSGDHESNIAPWLALELLGVHVKFWDGHGRSRQLRVQDLESLLSPRTKLVAVTHTSNILGTINPIREIADSVHKWGALLCVDGVAYAPHRAIDVQALDVDFYAFSFYKTYGPHHAMLYGKRELLLELPSRSFFFIAEDDVPYKFQPGGVNYELSYGMIGLMDYLDEVASRGAPSDAASGGELAASRHGRAAVESAFAMIAEHEEALSSRLFDFLRGRAGVRIVGHDVADRNVRVPIVSFVVDGMSSCEVVTRMDEHRVAIRFGHFYSPRLLNLLGLDADEGVIRVSMVHYNTLAEVDRLTTALDSILPGS